MKRNTREKLRKAIVFLVVLMFIASLLPMIFGR
nr:DUF4044 domain-containing protein [Clostridium magnum]